MTAWGKWRSEPSGGWARAWPLLLAGAIVLHLATPLVLTFDSGDYLAYLPILEGRAPWRQWDVTRGPVFPGIIFLSNHLFGVSATGFLITTGIFLSLLVATLRTLGAVLLGPDRKGVMFFAVLVCAFNPITFGWYHVMLTEFVATTILALCCWLAFEWVRAPALLGVRARAVWITLAFAVLVPLAWHLKQPYVGAALFPLVAAAPVAVLREASIRMRARRILLATLPCLALAGSIAGWERWVSDGGRAANPGRGSSLFLVAMLVHGLPHWTGDGYLSDWESPRVLLEPTLPAEAKRQIESFRREHPTLTSCAQMFVARDETGSAILRLPLFCSGARPTVGDALRFVAEQTRRLPGLTIRAYATSYLTMIGLMSSRDPSENEAIALTPYSLSANSTNLLMTPLKESYGQPYRTVGGTPLIGRLPALLGVRLWFGIFALALGLGPLLWIPLAVLSAVTSARHAPDAWIFMFIASLSGFLHILAHALLGATIDRYASPVFPVSGFTLVLCGSHAFGLMRTKSVG